MSRPIFGLYCFVLGASMKFRILAAGVLLRRFSLSFFVWSGGLWPANLTSTIPRPSWCAMASFTLSAPAVAAWSPTTAGPGTAGLCAPAAGWLLTPSRSGIVTTWPMPRKAEGCPEGTPAPSTRCGPRPSTPNPPTSDFMTTASSLHLMVSRTAMPSIRRSSLDPTDGRLWLTYGTYFGYIRIIELDPKTGKRVAGNKPVNIAIDWKPLR